MKTQRIKKALGTALLAGSLNSQSLAEMPSPELSFTSKEAWVGDYGLNTQQLVNYNFDQSKLTGLLETLPNGDINAGLDFRSPSYRLNFGLGNRDGGEELGRASFTYYPEEDSLKSFIGTSLQHIPEGDRAIFFGGLDLSDKLHLEGTFDTAGNVRGTVFTKFEGGLLGLGGGIDTEGNLTGELSYNTDKIWTDIKFGDRPLDARLVIGKVDPVFTRYVASVTEQGNNELDVFPDQTLKFDIGNKFFDFYGVGFFLGKEEGDMALDLRYKENERVYANVAMRLGEIGPLEDVLITAGPYYDIANKEPGITFGLGTKLLDGKLDIRLKADIQDDEQRFGIFGSISF